MKRMMKWQQWLKRSAEIPDDGSNGDNGFRIGWLISIGSDVFAGESINIMYSTAVQRKYIAYTSLQSTAHLPHAIQNL